MVPFVLWESWASSTGGSEETSMERSERLTPHLICTFSVHAQDWAQPCWFLKYTDDTYLTMVSVQVLEFLDITDGDPLGQRRSAQVRRGKGRQGVRCICRKTRLKQVSETTGIHILVTMKGIYKRSSISDYNSSHWIWSICRFMEPNRLLFIPMYCWWCWLCAATDCSGVLLQCWELPHRLSDIPSTFCRGLNLYRQYRRYIQGEKKINKINQEQQRYFPSQIGHFSLHILKNEMHGKKMKLTLVSGGQAAASWPCTGYLPAAD